MLRFCFSVLRGSAVSVVLFFCSAVLVATTDAALASDANTAAPQLIRAKKTVQLKPGQAIVIENTLGDVYLRYGGPRSIFDFQSVAQGSSPSSHKPSEGGTASKHANAAPSATLTIGKTATEASTLRASMKTGELSENGERIDITAFIPSGHPVSVITQNGVIEVRNVRSPLTARSASGAIKVRGVQGAIDAESAGGDIDVALETAPSAIQHCFSSQAGQITLSLAANIDASIEASTSALFGTEFSLEVTELPGQEPNKIAQLKLGKQDSAALNQIKVMNKRGEIRLFRRRDFNAVVE